MIRSRRPLYHRLLRLRVLRPGQITTFLLFEGSVMVAILLALAEVVDWWGVLAIPVAVAVMVKLNDAVAAVLRRPVAVAQLDRSRLRGGPAVGISARPTTARLTSWISRERDVVARGIAAVPQPEHESGPAPHARRDGDERRRRDRGNQGRFAS